MAASAWLSALRLILPQGPSCKGTLLQHRLCLSHISSHTLCILCRCRTRRVWRLRFFLSLSLSLSMIAIEFILTIDTTSSNTWQGLSPQEEKRPPRRVCGHDFLMISAPAPHRAQSLPESRARRSNRRSASRRFAASFVNLPNRPATIRVLMPGLVALSFRAAHMVACEDEGPGESPRRVSTTFARPSGRKYDGVASAGERHVNGVADGMIVG